MAIGFNTDTIHLAQAKFAKLAQQLKTIGNTRRVPCKDLERCLGLLVWACSISPHLRPFLAPLFRDLHQPPATMYSISAPSWPAFLASLDPKARVLKPMPGLWIPVGATIIEAQHQTISKRSELPTVPRSHKPTWVRASDPQATKTQLRKDTRDCLAWLTRCIQQTPVYPVKQAPILPCLAAADACAEGHEIGIGGWIISRSHVIWFGETWTYAAAQEAWPCLQAPNSRAYIACFETIAQFALLKAAHQRLGHSHYAFTLPTSSDNIATEAGVNSLFTMALEPLPTPSGSMGARPRRYSPGEPRGGSQQRVGRPTESQRLQTLSTQVRSAHSLPAIRLHIIAPTADTPSTAGPMGPRAP